MKSKKRILITPLNWGIGHATRCIPIIKKLLTHEFEVIIAASGRSLRLLEYEFPNLQHINLKDYNIKYSNVLPMSISIIFQLPKLFFSIKKEEKTIKSIIESYNIDGVISDNRYGCYSKKIPCVFITHQLQIKSPRFQKFIQKINYHFIQKFTECWVVDDKQINLAGSLSKPNILPKKTNYIGVLSRFKKIPTEKKYKILAIVSGPEPQRTTIEKKLILELQNIKEKSLIVLGKPEKKYTKKTNNLTIKSFLDSKALNLAIESAEIIICRSGYSTIMDLKKLGKKAILIPTPGQTEQEYIAERLFKKGICYMQKQKAIDLNLAINESKKYSGFETTKNENTDWEKLFSLF